MRAAGLVVACFVMGSGGQQAWSAEPDVLEDYTLHFCSTTCWDHFNADPAAGLAGLIASVPPASKK